MTGSSGATNGCTPVSERLPELALGILGGADRADVLAHLDQCAKCRDASMAWAATVDALPELLGEAEPPAGFEARTLERIRADQRHGPRRLPRRRSTMQRVLAVAAIVAVAMIGTLATVRILDARSSSSTPSATAEITSARMIGVGGHRYGDAFMTSGHEPYVFLDVDYGTSSGRYRIEAVDAANNVKSIGAVTVTAGHGVWAGEAGAAKDSPPSMVRLIDEDGAVVCAARFGTVAT
jgi:Putative zinc-finger